MPASIHLDEQTALAFAAGQLAPAERAEAIEHIGDCSSCRKLVAELSRQHPAVAFDVDANGRTLADRTQLPTHVSIPPDRLLGVKLGDYTVETLISRGGMGAVYRAVNPVNGRAVAIKVLLPHVASDPDQMHRLLTEARAVADIKHPNIVDIYGFGVTPDDRHYFVMQLVEGEPLSALLGRRGKLAPSLALELLDQLLSALEAAHERGVVHRDLKPHNLVIHARPDSTTRLTVLDFGLAKRLGERSHTAPDLVLGTPGYMSPEQISGDPIGPRADLYAVGALAFRMFTGQDAFAGANVVGVMRAQIEDAPPRVSSKVAVPAALDALVDSLLSRDPAGRPVNARAVLSQLRTISFNWVDARTITEKLSDASAATTQSNQPAAPRTSEASKRAEAPTPAVGVFGVDAPTPAMGSTQVRPPPAMARTMIEPPPLVARTVIGAPPALAPKLSDTGSRRGPPSRQKKSSGWVTVIVIALVLIAAAAVVVFITARA